MINLGRKQGLNFFKIIILSSSSDNLSFFLPILLCIISFSCLIVLAKTARTVITIMVTVDYLVLF